MAVMKLMFYFSVCLFFPALFFGFPVMSSGKDYRNVLLINSYQQGLSWTDSVTSGIISNLNQFSNINLYVESLNSKKFGQQNFQIEKDFIQHKYSGIKFDGILVTDNDALEFALQYDKILFPNIPVVFAGITNPQDYPLDGSLFYGYKELDGVESSLSLIKRLLPGTKRLLVLTDHTKTGQIYKSEFLKQAAKIKDLSIVFPDVINLDSILNMVNSAKSCDAMFYMGISQDGNGRCVDYTSFINEIGKRAKVPLFSNSSSYMGKGVVGCIYQSGKKHGYAASQLLVRLIDSTLSRPVKHIYELENNFCFDLSLSEKYSIPLSRIPMGSKLYNDHTLLNKKNFILLIGVTLFLIFIVFYLYMSNRKIKKAESAICMQLKEIEVQNSHLKEVREQLNMVISEKEKANNQLEEARKKAEESDNLKSAFLANVSHEIRTPLNAIVGFSYLLNDPDIDNETRKKYSDLIESNTESLLVLIDEIIDLSKIEARQLTLKKGDFSIDVLLEELYHIFVQENRNENVEIRVCRENREKELFIFSDRVRVKQIFINLLSNALKFTDKGIVDVGYFSSEKQGVIFYVRDTGIGIEREHHKSIFQRFRKLNENQYKRIYRGTGLGLAITQKLVELLGGKIWIESQPGVGSVFYFTLMGVELKEPGIKKPAEAGSIS